jgi:hypothetical protein
MEDYEFTLELDFRLKTGVSNPRVENEVKRQFDRLWKPNYRKGISAESGLRLSWRIFKWFVGYC